VVEEHSHKGISEGSEQSSQKRFCIIHPKLPITKNQTKLLPQINKPQFGLGGQAYFEKK
jgi:hypothetical protein